MVLDVRLKTTHKPQRLHLVHLPLPRAADQGAAATAADEGAAALTLGQQVVYEKRGKVSD